MHIRRRPSHLRPSTVTIKNWDMRPMPDGWKGRS